MDQSGATHHFPVCTNLVKNDAYLFCNLLHCLILCFKTNESEECVSRY